MVLYALPKWLIQIYCHANVVLSFCAFHYLLENYHKTIILKIYYIEQHVATLDHVEH